MKTPIVIARSAFLLALFCSVTLGQTNRPPVFISHPGDDFPIISSGKPVTFKVSARDPEGEPVTFTWKRDGLVVKSGADTFYTATFVGPYGEPHNVVCIAADPEGLQDSTMFLFIITAVNDQQSPLPVTFSLQQNYPNPFNPSTTMSYSLSKATKVSLGIFNTLGQAIVVLVNERKDAGLHQIQWNANVPSGIYFYRLQAGEYVETKKMVLLK
jgi:hypothetical protein